MEEYFGVSEEKLLQYYDLNSLHPSESWQKNSTKLIDLSKWQDTVPITDNSYDILKDLISQQQNWRDHNDMNNPCINKDLILDPLHNEKIVPILNMNNIPIKEQSEYLINNKSFDVIKFLKTIHDKDSFDDLSRSLDNLDMNLQNQSNELKLLVQENFTKYVKVKNRLDQIYQNFSIAEDNSTESTNTINVETLNNKVEEEVMATHMKLKPLLDTSKKISNYQLTKIFIEENREFIDSTKVLKSHLLKNDYKSLMLDYSKTLATYNEIILLYETHSLPIPAIVSKIWSEVEKIVGTYRKQIWNSLINIEDKNDTDFLVLISKFLDLDLKDSNPILEWILTRLGNFQVQIDEISSDMKEKLLQTQKSILANFNGKEGESVELIHYLSINRGIHLNISSNEVNNNQSGSNKIKTSGYSIDNESDASNLITFQGLTDSSIIVEMWLQMLRLIKLLEAKSLEFIEFWEHVEKFLDGTYQNSLLNDKKKENILIGELNSIDDYKNFLFLEDSQTNDIRRRGDAIIDLISSKLLAFFQSSQSNLLNGSQEMINKSNTETHVVKGNVIDYGFIPPNANGLSCLRYLPKIVEPILKFTTELAQLNISAKSVDQLREVVSVVLDCSVGAISATKLRDISNFYKLEDWHLYETAILRYNDRDTIEYGVTQFPEIVRAFQEYSIKTVRDLLFSFEKLPILNGISIVSYPSKQLLSNVEMQQIVSMESVLEAILKNAAKDKDNPRNSHTILTLTNLQYIREVTFQQILQYFDDAFEWNLKDKNLELFNLLSKMEQSIFGNYLSDLKINLRDILEVKFREISWATYTSNSFRVSDYIIEGLMILINVHSECFRIGPQLINKILQETQIFIAKYLFESFKPFVGNISSDGLLQVTVDLQFFQTVLDQLLEKDTKITLAACLQNCFQNNTDRLQKCIHETETIVQSNLTKTSIQFAAFK